MPNLSIIVQMIIHCGQHTGSFAEPDEANVT